MSFIYSPTSSIFFTSDSPAFFSPVYAPPLVTSVNLAYSKPLISTYEDLNADRRVHKKMIKYFFYKTLDKWLYDELSEILNYFVIKGDRVELISNLSQFNSATGHDSQASADKKVKYIENNVISPKFMSKILYKYVQETGTHWYDLTKNEFFIRQVLKRALSKRIRKAISRANK